MKHLLMATLLLFGFFSAISLPQEKKLYRIISAEKSKIDFTINLPGYTIRVSGESSISPFSQSIRIKGTITIKSEFYEITFPIEYSGPMKKGPNDYKYQLAVVDKETNKVADFIMSRIYLNKDYRKSYFDNN